MSENPAIDAFLKLYDQWGNTHDAMLEVASASPLNMTAAAKKMTDERRKMGKMMQEFHRILHNEVSTS